MKWQKNTLAVPKGDNVMTNLLTLDLKIRQVRVFLKMLRDSSQMVCGKTQE